MSGTKLERSIRPTIVLVGLPVLLLTPLLQAQEAARTKPEPLPLLRRAAQSMDQTGNYTARIKKTQETEVTSELFNRTREISGTLRRTGTHVLIQRTTKTTVKQDQQKNTTKKNTRLLGTPDPAQPLLIQNNDQNWTRFSESVRGDATALRKHILRGVEARSVALMRSAELDATVSFRDTPCYRISAVGSTDRIKSMISDVYRSLGGNARVTMKLRKASFTFWVPRTNPRILKFTSDIRLLLTIRSARSPGQKHALQVLDTTYSFSKIDSTTIPKKARNTYQKQVRETD